MCMACVACVVGQNVATETKSNSAKSKTKTSKALGKAAKAVVTDDAEEADSQGSVDDRVSDL